MIGPVLDEALAARLRRAGAAFTGPLDNPKVLKTLAGAHFYTLPARRSLEYGGLTQAAVEAMSLGVPVASPVLSYIGSPVVKLLLA